MLANYLAENYSSYDDVDWEKLSQMTDFKGHSSLSLRRLVSQFRIHAIKKYNISPREISLKDISKYCNEVYGEGFKNRGNARTKEKQDRVIECFEKKVAEMGITDFL